MTPRATDPVHRRVLKAARDMQMLSAALVIETTLTDWSSATKLLNELHTATEWMLKTIESINKDKEA